MLDDRPCRVTSAAQLDAEIRDIFAQDMEQEGSFIGGKLHVHYTDESVKEAELIPLLEARGVQIVWHKEPQCD